MKGNLKIYYDPETDILEIQIGEPAECFFDEIGDDLFEEHDEKTGELKGYKIFNFRKRVGINGVKEVQIPLPANIGVNGVC